MTLGSADPDHKSASAGHDEPAARPRGYHSPRRQARAAATRAAIAAAARRSLAQRGWAGTTVRAVAEAAGVSEPTVYNAYGSKTGLARALVEAIEDAADFDRQVTDLAAAEGDPGAQLRAMVAFDRRLYEGGADVLVALRDAGRSEEGLAEAYAEGRAGADRLRHSVIGPWPADALRSGIDQDEAVDTYAAMCNIDVYRVLTEERGWSPDHVERWLGDALQRLLLA